MEAVSIILKVWNAAQHVKLCLEGLLQYTTSPFELIVVDNGSKPRLQQWLAERTKNDARIRLIRNEVNRGPGYANRQGAALARHRLLCLMDSDVLVPPGWLERLTADFDATPGLKILAPLQPEESTVYPFESDLPDSRQVWYEVRRQFPQASPVEQLATYTHGLSFEDFEVAVRKANPGGVRFTSAPPDFVSSACLLVERDYVMQIGGIADPVFRGYGSEDVDLCWRVGSSGGMVGKTGSVYVHHFLGASLEANSLERAAALEKANNLLYAKWKEQLISLVRRHADRGIEGVTAYLEQHFIYSALARSTPLIDDLRLALHDPEIPEDIQWRPG